jgi:hypothetical protein
MEILKALVALYLIQLVFVTMTVLHTKMWKSESLNYLKMLYVPFVISLFRR